MTIPLRQMKLNQRGRVASISGQGELNRRIRDLGIVPGSEFEVVGRAPLKDPVALRLKGFTITLRNSEADYINCEVIDDE